MSCVVYSFGTRKVLPVILFAVLTLWLQLSALANQNVQLTWTPSTNVNVAGYNIYYGTQSQVYTNEISVGIVTNTVISNLVAGTTYYFSATTYDRMSNQSGYSPEANFMIPWPVIITNLPPTLQSLANLTVERNSASQTISLAGITPGTTNGLPLKVTVTSSNTNLLNPVVSYQSPKSTGTLTFKPSLNTTGSVSITVTVNNGGSNNNTVSKTFVVSVVTPVTKAMVAEPPKIFRQPQSLTVAAGKMAILSVGVSGKAPFAYQWQFNGVNVPGATGSFLFLRDVTTDQAGQYSVQISNSYGATNSAAMTLTVPGTANVSASVSVASAQSPVSLSQPAQNLAANLVTTTPPGPGQFSFQVIGIANASYAVQASPDLAGWTSICTNQSPFTYTDTNTLAHSRQFYRAVYLQP